MSVRRFLRLGNPTDVHQDLLINNNVNHNKANQWELEANARDQRQARENARDQVVIGWEGGASFLKPITERSKAKPKQFWITFDTQFKTALFNMAITYTGVSLLENMTLFIIFI